MTIPKMPRGTGWALALLPLALAACSSGSGSGSGSSHAGSTSNSAPASAQLKNADATILDNLTTYLSKANACKSQASPVVCLETADRTLGGQVHDYANKLATGTNFGAKATDVTGARNAAQLLANSMEILGDAQPTQANYDQVLNTFNVNNAITTLQKAVTQIQGDLS
jgi:hypothetical protein